jgi:hypothetical protein
LTIAPEPIPSKWQVRCIDHHPPYFGEHLDAKYKAEQEMWRHRKDGHVHAEVVPAIVHPSTGGHAMFAKRGD